MNTIKVTALSTLAAVSLLAGCDMTSGGKSAAVSMKGSQAPTEMAQPNQPLTREQILAMKDAQARGEAPAVAVEPAKPAVTSKPTAAPQHVAAASELGTAACPATPIQGKWMSEEVRQGSNNQLVPVAIGYMFRADGYFATAMFDTRTGEKVGEFDGQYRTLKANGQCVIKFDVPNSPSPVTPIGYRVNNGKLIINDNKSQSQALLARM